MFGPHIICGKNAEWVKDKSQSIRRMDYMHWPVSRQFMNMESCSAMRLTCSYVFSLSHSLSFDLNLPKEKPKKKEFYSWSARGLRRTYMVVYRCGCLCIPIISIKLWIESRKEEEDEKKGNWMRVHCSLFRCQRSSCHIIIFPRLSFLHSCEWRLMFE